MSRYALWLIPLVVPVIGRLAGAATRQSAVAMVLMVRLSIYVSTVTYQPGRPDGYYTPSWIASWIWKNVPWLDNPPRQIFFERVAGGELSPQTVAIDSCSKVLVIDGRWPVSCPMPGELPELCTARQAPNAFEDACYANRSGDAYTFARAP
jgi:hypothetical protein